MTTTFAQGPRTRTHRAFHEDLARGHHVPFTTALHEDALCTRNSPKDEPRQGLVHMRTLQGEVPCTTASHEDEPCTRDSQTAVHCTRTLHKRGYQRAQGRASCEGFARGRSWHWGLARGLSMSGALHEALHEDCARWGGGVGGGAPLFLSQLIFETKKSPKLPQMITPVPPPPPNTHYGGGA